MIRGLRRVRGGVDYNEMARFRSGSQNYRQGFMESFTEGLEAEEINPESFSLRMLFESLIEGGREIIDSWNPQYGPHGRIMLTEAGGVVSTADFSNITGQIMYATILKAWQNPMLLQDQLTRNVPTPYSGEKIPGIGNVGDVAQVVREGRDFPVAGVSEEWIETPQTTKRGFLVEVTKEAAYFDRTGQVLQRCREITTALAINKEKRVLDAVCGITDLYRRNGGAAQATYGSSHTNGDFSNLKASNGLTDWTNIEAAELVFDAITDPNTGEPILIDKTQMQILVATAKNYSASFALSPDVVRREDRGSSAAATITETRGRNPVRPYPVLSNAYVKSRSSSDTTWWIGNFQDAFEYRENWPITPVTSPASNHDEIHRDIIQTTKVSEMGAVAVVEPRKVVKNTA